MRKISKSIKSKIVLVVAISLILSVVINMSISMSGYGKVVESAIKSNLTNGVSSYRKNIDNSLNILVDSILSSRLMGTFLDSLEGAENESQQEAMENQDESEEHTAILTQQDASGVLELLLLDHSTHMFALSFADLNGTILASTDSRIINTDIANEAVEAIKKGASYYLGGYEELKAGKRFMLYIPLQDEQGTSLGIFAAHISVAYLANAISGSDEYTEDMYMGVHSGIYMEGLGETPMYIMDTKGTLLVDTDSSYVGTAMPEDLFHKIYELSHENRSTNLGLYEAHSVGGASYVIGYSWIEQGDWYIVVEVNPSEILAPLKSVNTANIVWTTLLLVIVVISAYFVARNISRPIEQTTEVLRHMADLDFVRIDSDCISGKQDETGVMADSIKTVVSKLEEIFCEMGSSAMTIHSSSIQLNEISQTLEENAKENLCITQELVAGVEESVATFEQINSGVASLRESSNVITERLTQNVQSCSKMLDTVNRLNMDTEKAAKVTREVYAKVRAEVDDALIGAKAVDKVNTMANAIMDIAGQTSLLALNASIEAARAGEAGRGFAVVAEEIGNLAKQSSEIVSNITGIINEVNVSVGKMIGSLETSLSFMERNVLKDYEKFTNVSSQYSGESRELRDEIHEITDMIRKFLLTLEEISTGINTTTSTLEASSRNTNVIAEKNAEVVEISTKTFEMAVQNKEKSEVLAKLVEQFKI